MPKGLPGSDMIRNPGPILLVLKAQRGGEFVRFQEGRIDPFFPEAVISSIEMRMHEEEYGPEEDMVRGVWCVFSTDQDGINYTHQIEQDDVLDSVWED